MNARRFAQARPDRGSGPPRAANALVLVCAAAAMGACASVPFGESLDTEKPCCASVNEFRFEPMPLDKEMEVAFGAGALAYSFPEGMSYFRAFELPQRPAYELGVAAEMHGSQIPGSRTFYPKFIFLSDRKEVVDTIEPHLVFETGFSRAFFVGSISLSPRYRYVVVYTDHTLLGRQIYVRGPGGDPGSNVVPVPTGPVVWPAMNGNRGAAGTVVLTYRTSKPRK